MNMNQSKFENAVAETGSKFDQHENRVNQHENDMSTSCARTQGVLQVAGQKMAASEAESLAQCQREAAWLR